MNNNRGVLTHKITLIGSSESINISQVEADIIIPMWERYIEEKRSTLVKLPFTSFETKSIKTIEKLNRGYSVAKQSYSNPLLKLKSKCTWHKVTYLASEKCPKCLLEEYSQFDEMQRDKQQLDCVSWKDYCKKKYSKNFSFIKKY